MQLHVRYRIAFGLLALVGIALLSYWMMPNQAADSAANVPAATVPNDAKIDAENPSVSVPEDTPGNSSANITAAAAGTFRGRVIDAVTRAPVREFELAFVDRAFGKPQLPKEISAARTFKADDGRFEWTAIPAGNWTVVVRASGYQRFDFAGLNILAGATTREILLPLRAGYRLHGRVYDASTGAGIADATIVLRPAEAGRFDSEWRQRPSTTSARDGSFVLNGAPAGRLTLQVSRRKYAGKELTLVAEEATEPLQIGLASGGIIAGRLVAADGITPLEGTASLFHVDEAFGTSFDTGPGGEFSFPHLPAGHYTLEGSWQGAVVTRKFTLAENQRIEDLKLALGAGHSIRGKVTGVSAEDLQRVQIAFDQEDGLFGINSYVKVDETGAYTLRGVAPGTVRLMALLPNRRQLAKTVEMPAQSDLTVDLDFPAGSRLSGRITRGGKPLADVPVQPVTPHQPQYFYAAYTAPDGTYSIDDLPDGRYSVLIGTYKAQTVEVAGDTVFNLDIPGTQLIGNLYEAGGEVPIVGADVVLARREVDALRAVAQDRSNDFGKFSLKGMETGTFVLTIYKPGFELYRESLAYGASTGEQTISLRRSKGVAVQLRAVDGDTTLQRAVVMETQSGISAFSTLLAPDEAGTIYLPNALAGSTLTLMVDEYAPVVVREWNGQELTVQLQRRSQR